MRVAVVYQYFQDHGAPGHSLVYELTQSLAGHGHEVVVVAGEAGYMRRHAPSLPWYRRFMRTERVGQVEVVRTYAYHALHGSYAGRLLSFLSFSLTSALGLLRLRKPDVVLASSPPIFPIFAALLVCRLRRIPFVLEVRDLWPASAVQMGILRSKALIAVMAWMERVLYNHAVRIIALTQGIADDIAGRGWPRAKIEVITCGVDASMLYPDPAAGERTRLGHGWQGKQVVLYFGAIGEANNLPVILRAARRLSERNDILFVLVGDGMKRGETERAIAAQGLANVQLLPPVPKSAARDYINAADLCLVTLKDIPLFHGAIPTKLIDYMACGKAVLGGLRGEAATIMDTAGAGRVFSPDADDELAAAVADLLAPSNRAGLDRMGRNGASYVNEHFSAERMRRRMEDVLRDVADAGAGRREGAGRV